ncbi:MAG: hypothetical protein CVU71_09120 [Deltaproteobacteria bacterium HGW-Deltaproteobacteria-6]|jgi:Fe-S cluster assembly iron-binding protein IscA|nr:MAG: hypothetical protein CVU71_09120 [Deltaproteobacteria bacterium HGW-Deltaproteobacteria-6]
MITLTPEAVGAMQTFLAGKESPKSIRIHLRSTGCCDASLGLTVDNARADDLTFKVQGIVFVVSPELDQLTGNIAIDYVEEKQRTGFVLTSARPVSEWDGFGVCTLKD